MTTMFDLVVIGAGPAGSSAALAASEQGLRVGLIDEQAAVGGQVFRAPASAALHALDDGDPDLVAGDELRRRIAASTVKWLAGRRVWSLTGGFRVDVVGPDGHEAFTAPLLVAATGAHERVVPFPGWTLPGVLGLAAATILLKSQAMLPGEPVVIAGCGPLLAAVAGKIAASGGNIAAVVDLAGPTDWLVALPGLARRPRLLKRGLGWVLAIGRARVPVYFRHGIRAAKGGTRIERVVIGPVGADGAAVPGTEIAVDAASLVIGHGLVPGADIPRLLRAQLDYDRRRGGWIPRTDSHGRTTVRALYAVGDGAGICGAEPALLAGRLAGLAAAHDSGRLSEVTFARLARPIVSRLTRYRPFADAVAAMMALRPAQVAAIPPETIVCRCEDIDRATIDAAARDGALDVNQLKHFTRCGMGPCQGRMCGDVAAELLAQARGVSRESVGYWTGRPPLRPVPLQDLLGTFSYADIPIPTPAPL
jgi:thioredoxin reductase/bacterioferritin-associated ferredoxin